MTLAPKAFACLDLASAGPSGFLTGRAGGRREGQRLKNVLLGCDRPPRRNEVEAAGNDDEDSSEDVSREDEGGREEGRRERQRCESDCMRERRARR